LNAWLNTTNELMTPVKDRSQLMQLRQPLKFIPSIGPDAGATQYS
jgi:hypothetical protein